MPDSLLTRCQEDPLWLWNQNVSRYCHVTWGTKLLPKVCLSRLICSSLKGASPTIWKVFFLIYLSVVVLLTAFNATIYWASTAMPGTMLGTSCTHIHWLTPSLGCFWDMLCHQKRNTNTSKPFKSTVLKQHVLVSKGNPTVPSRSLKILYPFKQLYTLPTFKSLKGGGTHKALRP